MLNLVREEVIDSIEQIPMTISDAMKHLNMYPTDLMRARVSQLFVAILELLEECLVWLGTKPARKVLSATLKGEDHGSSLKDKREQLLAVGARIDRDAQFALHGNVNGLHEGMAKGKRFLAASRRSGRPTHTFFQLSQDRVLSSII